MIRPVVRVMVKKGGVNLDPKYGELSRVHKRGGVG